MLEDANTIVLNRAADFWFPFGYYQRERDPVTGERVLIDASKFTSRLIVYSGHGNEALFTLDPPPYPNDPRKLWLQFTEEHAALLTRKRPFILRASYPNNYDEVIWSGTIYSTGFAV